MAAAYLAISISARRRETGVGLRLTVPALLAMRDDAGR